MPYRLGRAISRKVVAGTMNITGAPTGHRDSANASAGARFRLIAAATSSSIGAGSGNVSHEAPGLDSGSMFYICSKDSYRVNRLHKAICMSYTGA